MTPKKGIYTFLVILSNMGDICQIRKTNRPGSTWHLQKNIYHTWSLTKNWPRFGSISTKSSTFKMSANQDSDDSKGKLEPPDESKSVDSSDRTDNIDVAISSSLCFLTCLEISPKIEITNDINLSWNSSKIEIRYT